jgi:hypothetical protein
MGGGDESDFVFFSASNFTPLMDHMDGVDVVVPIEEEVASMCIGPDDEDETKLLPYQGKCLVCDKQVEGMAMRCCRTRILEEEEALGFRANVFCLVCYTKGKFEARCCACGMYQQCAPTQVGDPKFMCMGCQWSENGRRKAAEQASAKVSRTAT